MWFNSKQREEPYQGLTYRGLGCDVVCENCTEVCPNRANIAIQVPNMAKHQIIHVDYMCNECGNCKSFCPYASAPYLDKFTLFANEADMENSKNQGFTVLDREKKTCKVRLGAKEYLYTVGELEAVQNEIPEGIDRLIDTVIVEYGYLLEV